MKNEHNIDDLFREVVDGAEFAPSDKVWDSINKNLANKQPISTPRKVNPKMLAGVAALSILAVAVVTYKNISQPQAPVKTAATNVKTTVTTVPFTAPEIKEEAKNSAGNENVNSVPVVQKNTAAKNDPPKPSTVSEEVSGLTDRQEAMRYTSLKPHTISTITDPGKESTDKNIVMLPYYPSNYNGPATAANVENKQTDNSPSIKTEITDPVIKNEIKETVMYVPNAFTPNGDGLNDVFIPQTAENLKEYKLFIYDRNGMLVFQSDDISKGWDGRARGDEMGKEDIYMWKIELKNSKGDRENMMGYLNLLK